MEHSCIKAGNNTVKTMMNLMMCFMYFHINGTPFHDNILREVLTVIPSWTAFLFFYIFSCLPVTGIAAVKVFETPLFTFID